MERIPIVSVNAGRPAPLGLRRGAPVSSSIRKRPARTASLWLARTNLEGDEQADLRVHGGPDKAVYVYPLAHLRAWARELGEGPFDPGDIGENLTVAGGTEADVQIGDRWRWGEALVEVVQPRQPCFKLAMRTNNPAMTRLFERSGRTGWYLRVLEEGRVSTAGHICVERRDLAGLTVRRAHELASGAGGAEEIARAVAHPALGVAWRQGLERRLARLAGGSQASAEGRQPGERPAVTTPHNRPS